MTPEPVRSCPGRVVCVGICGGSCSGKGKLVWRLQRVYRRLRPTVIVQDNYYRDHTHLAPEDRAVLNYDEPASLDLNKLAGHLEKLKAGHQVAGPLYNFATHAPEGDVRLLPSRLVLLDGMLILQNERLRDLIDVKVFVEADAGLRYERRQNRDVRERGRTPESVERQWNATTSPMHQEWVEPQREWADVLISGHSILTEDLSDLDRAVCQALKVEHARAPQTRAFAGAINMEKCEVIRTRFAESIEVKQKAHDSMAADIAAVVGEMVSCLRDGGKVIFCGNGGSAADAQHLAAELVGRFQMERDALPSMALNVNTSSITAIGNDYAYDEVFARQARAFVEHGDVFVGLSTSGNSSSIIKAVQVARDKGAYTVGMTGASGGNLAEVAHLTLKVPSDVTARIQETHITIGHIVCELVESELFAAAPAEG